MTSCTILTTAPQGVFAQVHDRMPLLLPQDRWAAWLDPATPTAQVQALTAPSDLFLALQAYPVDPGSAMFATTGQSSPGR